MVEFMAPDGEYPMVPDKEDDEAKAMATVNTKMMVSSNMVAAITPMFVEGASPVGVMPGMDNMPFQYVDWGALQSHVIGMGATFAVHKASIGANQEMMPTGDAVYITCGPFECAMGDIDTNDGVDLGIVTSSSLEMNVKHVFSGVAGGTNTSKTVKAAPGSGKTLAMAAVASIFVDQENDVDGAGTAAAPYGVNEEHVCEDTADGMGRYDGGSLTDKPKGCFRLRGPGADRGDNDPGKGADYLSGWTIELSPIGGDVSWGRVDWEDNPFEDLQCGAMDPIVVADHIDICSMFDAEVDLATSKGWKPTVVFQSETPGFDSNTNAAIADQVVMWKADADRGSYTRMFKTIWFDDNLDGKILKDTKNRPMQADGSESVAGDKFNDLYNHNKRAQNIEQIWELLTDSNDDLTIAGDLGKVDLVSSKDDRDTADDERTIEVESCPTGTSWAPRDGYSADGTGTTRTASALDGTGCKTTAQRNGRLAGVTRIRSATATAAHPDGNADNYETGGPAGSFEEYTTTAANTAANRVVSDAHEDFFKCTEADGGDDDDNTLCDTEWMHDVTVTFADGTFGCSTTQDVTITCTWDADGGMAQGRNALPSEFDAGTNKQFFLKCTAS